MINFSTLQGLTIPEGVVTQIAKDGVVLWALSGGDIILEVEKITSDTYAGETTYTGEEFILLDIYPKTNGTVNITYGGLTKTITDTSGAEEPNAQQVFFGTFNGVSDSVATPYSGTLTIEGDCRGFGVGAFEADSKAILKSYYGGITTINNWGNIEIIPDYAFSNSVKLTSVEIPNGITNIGAGTFNACSVLESVEIPNSVTSIGDMAFSYTASLVSIELPNNVRNIGGSAFQGTSLESIEIPNSVTSIGDMAFSTGTSGAEGTQTLKSVKMLPTTPPNLEGYEDTDGSTLWRNFGELNSEFSVSVLEEIIVPKGCGNIYKAATGWSTYADYIVEAS